MMAAITAARAGAQVTVFERGERAGRKLAQTGNGRCNLTNLRMEQRAFYGTHPDFAMQALAQFDVQKTLAFFEELGVYMKYRGDYVYPNSDQAASVVQVLLAELARLSVRVICGAQVDEVRVGRDGRFQLTVSGGKQTAYSCDALILACGSKAAPALGGGDSGYVLARKFGHKLTKLAPALTALRCVGKYYQQMAGVRTDASITLKIDGKTCMCERGELQLTDYGISGIPVFQLSRFASLALHEQKQVHAEINFLPDMRFPQCLEWLKVRRRQLSERAASEFLTGVLSAKLAAVLLKLAGVQTQGVCRSIPDAVLKQLAKQLTAYEAFIASANPFQNAQVCAGGVDTAEINPDTMESRLVKGLYITGELLDVDAICGGYNLQWAWSSGYVAGSAAALV